MQTVILVGGLGTRLGSLGSETGKPMVMIAGVPFLELLIRQLARLELTDLVLCVGHQADRIQDHFADGRRFGVSIHYAVEDRPLGTAGALRNAVDRIAGDTFILTNGDSMVDFSAGDLLRLHQVSGAIATLTLVSSPEGRRFGTVAIQPDSRITRFAEKEERAGEEEDAILVNAGVYACSRELFDWLPSQVPASLERGVFPALTADARLAGYVAPGPLVDIGTPDALLAVRRDPSTLQALSLPLDARPC